MHPTGVASCGESRSGMPTPVAVQQTLELFGRLRAEHGVTVVMVTRDVDVATAAGRIVQLEAGRFVEQSTRGTLASGTLRSPGR